VPSISHYDAELAEPAALLSELIAVFPCFQRWELDHPYSASLFAKKRSLQRRGPAALRNNQTLPRVKAQAACPIRDRLMVRARYSAGANEGSNGCWLFAVPLIVQRLDQPSVV